MNLQDFLAAEDACSPAMNHAANVGTAVAIADMHIALAVHGLIATKAEHSSSMARIRMLPAEPGKKLDFFWIIPAEQATL